MSATSKCLNCSHKEKDHLYHPPSYNSDDGLPTFEGCFGDGVVNGGDPTDEAWEANPMPACDCFEFEPDEEDDSEAWRLSPADHDAAL